MNVLMSAAQINNRNNRNMQRKGKSVFQHLTLPVMSKTPGTFSKPVAPAVAREFRVRTESVRQRKDMAIGLLLILMVGISAAVLLAMTGMM